MSSHSPVNPPVYCFKRREHLPPRSKSLWQVRAGQVRLSTISDDASLITLGFWEVGDFVGLPLAAIEPFQIECLTNVEVAQISPNDCWDLQRVMLEHLGQMQELVRMRQGQILLRLKMLLNWLAIKFGQRIQQGRLIKLRLTHQQVAETIGTSRVTVTRMILQLERSNFLSYSDQQWIILRNA
ncbi:MAG: Crp/Fnr family transcriptional regulator [Cyanobacteria bacterium P01_F01_bin.56]